MEDSYGGLVFLPYLRSSSCAPVQYTCSSFRAGEVAQDYMNAETAKQRWISKQEPLPHKGVPVPGQDPSAMVETSDASFESLLCAVGFPSDFLPRRKAPCEIRGAKRGRMYFLFQKNSMDVHIDHRKENDTPQGLEDLKEWLVHGKVAVEARKLGEGDIVAFDPTSLHAVYNEQPVFSAGIHVFSANGREAVIYFVLGPGKTLITFPGMPPIVQTCLDDLGIPTTAELAQGGEEGAMELKRLIRIALDTIEATKEKSS